MTEFCRVFDHFKFFRGTLAASMIWSFGREMGRSLCLRIVSFLFPRLLLWSMRLEWELAWLCLVSVLERGFARGKANTQVLQCFGQTFCILDMGRTFNFAFLIRLHSRLSEFLRCFCFRLFILNEVSWRVRVDNGSDCPRCFELFVHFYHFHWCLKNGEQIFRAVTVLHRP